MTSLFKLLSVRLFLFLMTIMVLVFGVHIYLDVRITSNNLINSVNHSAQRAGELIARSTRHSMLLNRKNDVKETIQTLGNQPEFLGINIYNKAGETVFSTDSAAVGRKVDIYAEACVVCHAEGSLWKSDPASGRRRVFEAAGHERILGVIQPIRNEPACYNADCHVHGPDESILGVLDVKMSLAAVDRRVTKARNIMIFSSLMMALIISTVSGLFIYRMVQKPFRALKQGMKTISGGNLKTRLDCESTSEIGDLSRSFNKMADDLGEARKEVGEWAQTLEDLISRKSEELEQVQEQMIHMEKMASLGKLSASVAHEINNPIFGILTYTKLSQRELENDVVDQTTLAAVRSNLSVIQKESIRCGDIVRNLLDFARPTGGDFARYHLNESIQHTLRLVEHHFETKQISVKTVFTDKEDEITCDANQCQQAILALFMNAIESMTEGGSLTIETEASGAEFIIRISDTGAGIPEEKLPRIFEPFYTSKNSGARNTGQGLGLSVAYGIIKRHRGKIDVESSVGKGTTFTITVPVEQNPEWRI